MTIAGAMTMMAAMLTAGVGAAQVPEGRPDRPALTVASEGASATDAVGLDRDAFQQAREGERQARAGEKQAREGEKQAREGERQASARGREDQLFEQASSQMDAGRWDRALELFTRVVEMKGPRADGALYWTAYAQDRLGQRGEALTTIAELSKAFPQSRYVKQAQALDLEVRRRVGQPVSPESQGDEDLKLMAVNGLLNSDPEKALPILQKLLEGPASPRLRDRAVFVLAQSHSDKARAILAGLARGSATPELQSKAIQYLGIMGSAESRATLSEVYKTTTDVDIKRRVLRAFMVAGEKQRLLTLAQTEPNADLRGEAVRQLGVMGASDELWQMYQKDASVAVRKQILQAMFIGGDAARMIELARREPDAGLRKVAVRNLGLMGGSRAGEALVDIYGTDKDPAVRKAVIEALFLRSDAAALVAMARKESNVDLKRDIVQKLSLIQDKVATDYMIELLNK